MRMIAILAVTLLCPAAISAQDIEWKLLTEDLISGPVYVGPRENEEGTPLVLEDPKISNSVPDVELLKQTDTPVTSVEPSFEPVEISVPIDPRYIQPTPLTEAELGYARTAWAYFDANTHPETGLVPSVRKFKSMTLWDEGGYLLALVSAYKLELIGRAEASDRISKALNSLARLPLLDMNIPNKAYNIETLEMTDYANRPQPDGVGCSALDILRLMSGMLVVTQEFPEFLPLAQLIADRWDLSVLTKDQRLACFVVKKSRTKKRHIKLIEGRIGYEQYAGVTARELGLDAPLAYAYDPILRWQQ